MAEPTVFDYNPTLIRDFLRTCLGGKEPTVLEVSQIEFVLTNWLRDRDNDD